MVPTGVARTPSGSRGVWAVVAPLLVAAGLIGAAVGTAANAGCDDPGRYVAVEGGYELIGGCLAPGDVLVPGPAVAPADPDAEEPVES